MLAEPEQPETLQTHEQSKEIQHEDPKLLESKHSTKIKDLEDQLKRLAAEFDNYRKRTARDLELVREASASDVYLKFLPLIDEFELAVIYSSRVILTCPQSCVNENDKPNKNDKEFLRGFEMIYSKMLDMLNREGVEEMACLGQPFDPYRHDALRQDQGEEGKIVEVIQKGYAYRGKVLRHAKVVVGNGQGEKLE